MKSYSKFTFASAVLGLALAPALVATPVLVAGWDFNNISFANNVAANYSDFYNPFNVANDGVAAASRGTFLADGSGGSENLPLTASTGVSILTGSSVDAVDRFITTRGSQPGAVQNLGYVPSASEQAVGIAQRNTFNAQTFAFKIDSTAVKDLSLALTVAKSAVNNLTIDWSYKVGAGPVTSLGITTDLSLIGTTYTQIAPISFASATALNNQSEVYLIGAANTTFGTAFSLRLDNVAVYAGDLVPIPEPSTYAALLTVATAAVVVLRRRRQQHAVA